MKRKLSLLLAFVMIISLVPMSAFAASNNRVISVPTVADDHEFTVKQGDAPILRIEEEDPHEFDKTANGQIVTTEFRLNLTNAEWTDEITTQKVYEKGQSNAGAFLTFKKRTETSVTVTMNTAGRVSTKELVFEIPMLTELQGEKGEAKVTIEALDAAVSTGTYTFAIGQSGATTTTVGTAETISRSSKEKGASIIIDEIVAGSIKPNKLQRFTVRLPKDMKWHVDMESTGVEFDSKFKLDTSKTKIKTDENNGRDLKVEFMLTEATKSRGAITIKPLINVSKDAKFGDVEVSITATSTDISSESALKIAKYKDYGISVEVEEVIEVLSGRVDEDYVAKVTIEENVEKSLVEGREIDFELSDGAKVITGYKVEDLFVSSTNAKVSGQTSKFDTESSSLKDAKLDELNKNDEWSLKVDRDGKLDKKAKYELEIPVTVKGTVTGDVTLTVSGAGIEKTDIVIAKALAPVTVETKIADVRTGLQGQAGPDIIIKENYPGAIQGGKDRVVSIEFKDAVYGMRFDDAVVEVIDGDLDIDEKESGADDAINGDKDKAIAIYVDGDSTKASTIKISGIKMTLDRNVPEGPFQLDVKGNALVQNKDYDDFTSRVARFDYANVITKADGNVARTSKFVIDNKTYKVIEGKVEVEKTMDVAPFIQDGRTFLPIRHVAESLGVAENNIVWNANTKTVTIMKGDRIATMTIGSRTLTVNGTTVPMDTAAMIKDGRTVLPIRYVAQALGAQIDWDADTRTVTVAQ